MKRKQVSRELLEELYIKKKLSTRQISKIIGLSQKSVLKYLREFEVPVRTSANALIKYSRQSFSGDLCEKAYLLGLRTGDIHTRRHAQSIVAETTSPIRAQEKMFTDCFEKYGKVVSYEKKGGMTERTRRIYCALNGSFEFLLEKPQSIPGWILKDDGLFYSFLAGYADSEGSWIITGHKKYNGLYKDLFLSIATCDKAILEQINKKLKELGFKSHLYLVRKKGQYGNRICNFDLHSVRITRVKDVMNIAKILLPLSKHDNKKNKMQEMIELEPTFKRLQSPEIPCPNCNHNKLWKLGFRENKKGKFRRYVCPSCNSRFAELLNKRHANMLSDDLGWSRGAKV